MSKVKTVNKAQINGYLFDRPDLREITFGAKNTKAIAGDIDVLTNPGDEAQNVVTVSLFQAESYASGNLNPNYSTVKGLMDEDIKVYTLDGNRAATIRMDGSIDTQEYYRDTQKGAEGLELVEYNTPRGQFIHVNDKITPANAFEADAIIKDYKEDEQNGKRILTGTAWIFTFNNQAQTMKFRVEEPGAIDYIMTNYVKGETYAKLSGMFFAQTITTESDDAELGYGESGIRQEFDIKNLMLTGLGTPQDVPDGLLEYGLKERDARLAKIKSKAIDKLGTVGKSVDNNFKVDDSSDTGFDF